MHFCIAFVVEFLNSRCVFTFVEYQSAGFSSSAVCISMINSFFEVGAI